jgi:hypothetical protein
MAETAENKTPGHYNVIHRNNTIHFDMLPNMSHRLVYQPLLLLAMTMALNACKPASQEALGVAEGKSVSGKQIGLPCQLPTQSAEGSSKHLISFVVDGSASMAGFVKNSNSRYNKVIELLDNLTLVNPGQVEYLRVDENVKKMSRAEFQQAKASGFYTGKTNKIADVLESTAPKSEKLVMIVTDLQQDDGDTKQATKKLIDNYLQTPGYGVAVWGFKSEFDGLVYPPNSSSPYPYQTANLGIGHPFYLLIVGRVASINDFTKQFRAQGGALVGDTYNQLSIFSPDRLVEEVAYLQGEPKDLPENYSVPPSLLLNGVALKDGGQPIGLLEIGSRAIGKAKIKYSLPAKIAKDTVSSWITQVSSKVTKYDGQSSFAADSSVKPTDFQVSQEVKDQNISLSLDINADAFNNGLYYVTTDVQVTAVKTPEQWDAWNDSSRKNGAKTEGLKEFLDSMSVGVSSLTKAKPVTVARLCHGIQKN